MNATEARSYLVQAETRLARARTPLEHDCANALLEYHRLRVRQYEAVEERLPAGLTRTERAMLSRWYWPAIVAMLFLLAVVVYLILI